MSKRIPHGVAMAGAALCLLVAGAACGSDSSSDGSGATQGTTGAQTQNAGLPESIRSKGVVQIASDIPFPPYEFQQGGKLVGFEVDLANAMAKELGVSAEFVQLPFDGIIPALQARKYPIAMSAIGDTKEREKVLDFVNYALIDDEGILVPKGNPKNITGPRSLCGLKVAVTRGTIQARTTETYSKRCVEEGDPAIEHSTYQSDGAAQLTVKSGKADAHPSDAVALAYLAKTVDNGDSFEVVNFKDPETPDAPVGIALPKGQDEFRDALVGALTKVLASGEYERILAKYGIGHISVKSITVNSAAN